MEALADDFYFNYCVENPTVYNQLLQVVKTSNCKNCLSRIYYWKSRDYYEKLAIKQAMLFAKKSVNCYDKQELLTLNFEENKLLLKSISFLFQLNIITNNYKEAKKYITILIDNELSKKKPANINLLSYYYGLAYLNHRENKYDEAISNFLIADSLNNSVKSRYSDLNRADFYLALSNIYKETKNANKSIYYQNEALQNAKNAEKKFLKSGNKRGLYMSYLRSGEVFLGQHKFSNALNILNKVKIYFNKHKEFERLAKSYLLLGKTNTEINKFNLAKEYLTKAKNGYIKLKDSLHLGLSYYALGINAFKSNHINEANKQLYNALFIFNKQKSLHYQKNVLHALAILFEKKKNYKKALFYKKQQDSIDAIFQSKLYGSSKNDLEMQYKSKKKAQEIHLLKTKNELIEQQKLNQKIILLSGIGITTLFGLFFYFQYKNRSKLNHKLKELDQAKSTFFTNISHEFRTPLTLIYGPIEYQLQQNNLSDIQKRNLKIAKINTQKLENLVDQLLSLSKLKSGKLKLHVQRGNVASFISKHVALFEFEAIKNNIAYHVGIDNKDYTDWYDAKVVERIVVNLIGNAIKYTPENGEIAITTKRNNGRLIFQIKNSGVSMKKEELHRIFDRFYQANHSNKGVGIGLAVSKELAKLHKGSLTAKSTAKKITFEFSIPITKQTYHTTEIISQKLIETTIDFNETVAKNSNMVIQKNTDLPIVCIIEDNKDIQNYLVSIFEKNYQICIANNGEEGFKRALEKIPDLIISDIMMPKKDGISLTKQLKSHELTTHIPIILLTAKTTDTDQLKGLQVGADAYVKKPFNSNLLMATVKNLLHNRILLQQKITKDILHKSKKIEIHSLEDKFRLRIQKILDKNLTDNGFTIENLCFELGVSRMQLHRKLKAITGKTTSEFINYSRLQLAITLIKTKKISIAELAFAVGFNNASYFSKCFKKEFGCSPKEYAEKAI